MQSLKRPIRMDVRPQCPVPFLSYSHEHQQSPAPSEFPSTVALSLPISVSPSRFSQPCKHITHFKLCCWSSFFVQFFFPLLVHQNGILRVHLDISSSGREKKSINLLCPEFTHLSIFCVLLISSAYIDFNINHFLLFQSPLG